MRTTDGFELAEVDLDLRGEGTIIGERQKGRNDLKLASLRRDREWVVKAREVAFDLVDADPDLSASTRCSPTRSTCCTRTTTPSSCSRTDAGSGADHAEAEGRGAWAWGRPVCAAGRARQPYCLAQPPVW